MNASMKIPYIISTRRKFGVMMVAIAAMGMIMFYVVGLVHAQWHYVGSESSNSGHSIAFVGESQISGYYLIPIFLLGAIGVICWVWPVRKPPKLPT